MPVTIRKTLLLAFLLVGVTPSILLAALGFSRASAALQAEIEQGLVAQAMAIASDVNKLMYERLQNAATWSRLEVMQDLKVGDVDKRLSNFLHRLERGYAGIYRWLSASNPQGRVVASSDAAMIGLPVVASPSWQTVALAGDTLSLDLPGDDLPQAAIGLTIRATIESSFGSGSLGELRLGVDWTQVDRLLEQAAGGGRMVALLDRQGRLVAGSQRLLALVPRFTPDLADWARVPEAAPGVAVGGVPGGVPGGASGDVQGGGSSIVVGRSPLPAAPMIVGVGQARGFAGFAGFGWRVLVLVPRSDALAPVQSMALMFTFILGGVALLTLVAAGWVSREIARPIVALTDFTRRYRQSQVLAPPPAGRGAEVGELREAFVQMVAEIDQSQQKLARASVLAAVGEMSAVIAHEVRTPLGILRSSAQVLQRESGLSDEGRELLGFISSETERLNRLVSSMLESARPRAPRFAPADVNGLVRHSVGLLSAQAVKQQVRFTLRLDAGDAPLDCDAEQMTQVLLNLILNGLQILAHGGQIAITTRDEAGQVIIEVADDGPGIAPEARSQVFEAFFFQREGGLGLGLAVVQRIVAAHGGEIEAGESQYGGALFRIRLPRTLGTAQGAGAGRPRSALERS